MPGFVLSESDRSAVDAKYLCSYCGFLLRYPMQTDCGHCYCLSCIDQLARNRDSCLQCLVCEEFLPREKVYPDNFMKREVLGLKVHCRSKEEGCNWKGEVKDLEAHTSVCDFAKSACPYPACGMMVKKADLAQHLESECPCRLVECNYCKADINANLMKAHLNSECSAYPVKCSNCNLDVQRSKIQEHQEPVKGDCEAIAGPCPFVQAGCTQNEAMTSGDRKKHMKDALVPHLSLVLAIILNLRDQIQSPFVSSAGANAGAAASVIGGAVTSAKAGAATSAMGGGAASVLGGTLASAMGATASAAASFLSDSESTVRSLLSQGESVTKENKDLRQRLREQSDRISNVERRAVSLPSNSSEGASTCRSLDANPASTPQAEVARQLVTVGHRVADHEVLLGENGRNVEDARHQNSYLQRQLELARETIKRLERRVESQDHMMALRNVAPADLEEYIRQRFREQSDQISSVERKAVSLPSNSSEGATTCRSLNANPASTPQTEVARRLVNVERRVADHEVLLGENRRNIDDARHQNSYQQRYLELPPETGSLC